jgi:hypothetical protein
MVQVDWRWKAGGGGLEVEVVWKLKKGWKKVDQGQPRNK